MQYRKESRRRDREGAAPLDGVSREGTWDLKENSGREHAQDTGTRALQQREARGQGKAGV